MNIGSYNCCKNKTSEKTNIESTVSILKLVADASRLQILCILNQGTHCVCELIEHTALSQSLISHHLKDLKEARLVVDEKKGQWVHYTLTSKGKMIVSKILNITKGEI